MERTMQSNKSRNLNNNISEKTIDLFPQKKVHAFEIPKTGNNNLIDGFSLVSEQLFIIGFRSDSSTPAQYVLGTLIEKLTLRIRLVDGLKKRQFL